MNRIADRTRRRDRRGTRPARRPRVPVAAVIAASGLALLAAACGGTAGSRVAQLGSAGDPTHGGASSMTSTGSSERQSIASALAYSRCMRGHGVPNFPDPDGQGAFPPLSQQALGVSRQTSLAANEACNHLLRHGGATGTPQQLRQKFVFALKVAACMRTHGFPTYPDPRGSSQDLPPGINPNSPQFQGAETACEKQARHALGVP